MTKTKTKKIVNITETKTAAREDFGSFISGPRAPTSCRFKIIDKVYARAHLKKSVNK